MNFEYQQVSCFCDVDVNKIGKVYTYELTDTLPKPTVPIVHFTQASKPFILCVKMVSRFNGLLYYLIVVE